MLNYRKKPQISNRTMDGFIGGAPGQRRQGVRPQHKINANFRPRSSSVDDFKRPEGFHPNRNQATIGTPAQAGQKKDTANEKTAKPGQGSLLHMTLPGGSLSRRQNLKVKKHRKWYDVRRWGWRRTSLAAACLVLLLGGFLAFKGFLNLNKVFKGGGNAAALQETVTPDLLRGEGDGRINVLLLGRGGEGHDGADLTDTILVASIDPVNKTAGMVSIPRDFWVKASGQSSKINAVFSSAKNKALRADDNKAKAEAAGAEALKEVVSDVLGIPVHYYSVIDFNGFKKAVDVVGGVDIHVPEELAVSEHLWDSTTGRPYSLNVPAGQQHLDSTKALYFARSRKTSPRGDFDRAERQRLFISALSQKVLSAGTYTNPVKITQLMDAFGDHVATDFSVGDAARLAQIAKEIPGDKITSIGLADPPDALVHTDMINGLSVVVPRAGLSDYSEIHALVRAKLPDGYIIKENAKIDVLNGTVRAGLAKTKADELKTYGYNIAKVGDAPTKNYNKTVLVDLTGNKKPYTENYLEKRFGISVVSQLPDDTIQAENADFVIILGSNER